MKIVIIGGQAAGMSAAAKARRVDKSAEITVFEASGVISFGACGLPYYVGNAFQDPTYMTEFSVEQFAAKGIDVKIYHKVIKVDPIGKRLHILSKEGEFETNYDRLMIATGASDAAPPIQGLQLSGVHNLRVLDDGEQLKKAIISSQCHNVVIIGSGFIGLELAEALHHQGKTVRLIERAERVIPEAFDPEITQLLLEELQSNGILVHLGESVQNIKGEGHVTAVTTDKGEYATDLVVVCTGVKPTTDFVKDIGLRTLANGAICVDAEGKTSLKDIYSAGDCATTPHQLKGVDTYIPLATVANKLGRIVGSNLAGEENKMPALLGSAALRVLNLEAGRTGLSEAEAQILGLDYQTVFIKDKNQTNYCKGQSDLSVKLIYLAKSKIIIGGQIVGNSGAVHRLHAISVAITAELTTEQLGMIDFAYAPPFSRPWDVLNIAGNVAK